MVGIGRGVVSDVLEGQEAVRRDEAAGHAHGVWHIQDVVPVKGFSPCGDIREEHADGGSGSIKESSQRSDGGLVELLPGCRAEVEDVLIGLCWRQSELHRRRWLRRWLSGYGWLSEGRRRCLSWRVAALALSRVRRSSTHAGDASRAKADG